MARTNHINLADASGQVYCFHVDKIVKLTQEFLNVECGACPYFKSDSYGNGVECYFDDGSRSLTVVFYDPANSEKWSKYAAVRLGLKTREEVDGMLKGTSDLTEPKDLGIPEHLTAPIEAQAEADLEAAVEELEGVSRNFADAVSDALQSEVE